MQPHIVPNTYYQTASEALGLFFISFDDRVIDLEAYPLTSVTTNLTMDDPIPSKLGIVRTGDWT